MNEYDATQPTNNISNWLVNEIIISWFEYSHNEPYAKSMLQKVSVRPGGGGALSIYTGGGVPQHPKRGVLGTGTTQKKGVLGTGTTQKRGLRHGHESKKGGLRHGHESRRGVLRTGLVKKTILVTDVAQKGVLGAYLLITLTFFLST